MLLQLTLVLSYVVALFARPFDAPQTAHYQTFVAAEDIDSELALKLERLRRDIDAQRHVLQLALAEKLAADEIDWTRIVNMRREMESNVVFAKEVEESLYKKVQIVSHETDGEEEEEEAAYDDYPHA